MSRHPRAHKDRVGGTEVSKGHRQVVQTGERSVVQTVVHSHDDRVAASVEQPPEADLRSHGHPWHLQRTG